MVEVGTTNCKWDSVIPFNTYIVIKEGKRDKILYKDEFILRKLKEGINMKEAEKEWKENSKEGMWERLNKLIKDNGAIVLFGSEPFSSSLRISNIKNYRYDWIWEKEQATNFPFMKKQTGKIHEIISVFYKKQPTYNPIMRKGFKPQHSGSEGKCLSHNISNKGCNQREGCTDRYPVSIIKFNRDRTKLHPTQKPVALLEYLIKTYTNEGDLILDFTMGSGSTGVACMNTNRRFVGIELDENYFNIAKERLENLV